MYLLIFLLVAVVVVLLLFAFSGSLFSHKGGRGVSSSSSLQNRTQQNGRSESKSSHNNRNQQKTQTSSTNGAKRAPKAAKATNAAARAATKAPRASDSRTSTKTARKPRKFPALFKGGAFTGGTARGGNNPDSRTSAKSARTSTKAHAARAQTPSPTDGVKPGCCPLCGTPLAGGEQIKSIVFQGGQSDDRLCHIQGCPHCLPPESPIIKRVCPVCRKNVPQNGHLITRMFKRKNGAHHVHILGCTECHKKN